MHPPAIQKLIELFSKFPAVGPRTAERFVFYLLRAKDEDVTAVVSAISNLKQNVRICGSCFNPFSGEGNLCSICSDHRRDKTLLCLVANETDLAAVEKTKKYRGLYFILGGTVGPRLTELEKRAKAPEIKEIIIALDSTPEGETTALRIERLLKPLNKKITRLGRGLPVGGELEYADEETLSSALEGRK